MFWTFGRKKNFTEKLKKIQYIALKIIYNSNESNDELFMRSNEVEIHQKYLGALATEIWVSQTETQIL